MFYRGSEKSTFCQVILIFGLFQIIYTVSTVKDIIINGRPHRIEGTSSIINNVKIDYFAKIPYANPPVGNLKFKHPQEIDGDSWSGIYNSTIQPNTCWQADGGEFDKLNPAARLWLSKTAMSEDCLYLTVWAPKKPSVKLPVMVWIYGGSFLSGSSTLEVYDGSILASRHNVIVVSLQYRLGPMGFLYINDELSPGNQGLMDQRLALKWVKNNINNFNGDVDKITIFGESAGSASVSFHVLSPLSQDFFNRAIMESGTGLSPWAVETKDESKIKSIELAKNVNCGSIFNDDLKLLTCLESVDPLTLVNAQFNLRDLYSKQRLEIFQKRGIKELITDGSYFVDIYFKPIYDDFFIPKKVPTLMSLQSTRKNIDILAGFNANEGMYFLIYGLNKWLNFLDKGIIVNPDRLSSTNPNLIKASKFILENLTIKKHLFKSLIPLFMYEYKVPSKMLGYKQWTSLQVLTALDQMTGDELFVCPVVNFAGTMSENNQNVYLYNFLHRTEGVTFPKWTGTMHGYEVEYVFGMPFSDQFTNAYYNFSESERNLSDLVMTLWTNFAKFGNPTPKPIQLLEKTISWLPYNLTEPQTFHFSLSNEAPFRKNPKTNQCTFWSKVLPSLIAEFKEEIIGKTSSTVHRCWILTLITSIGILLW